MPNKALRNRVITLDDGHVTEVQSDIVDESLHGQVERSEERDAVRVNADSESERGSLENERELVFEIPSVLAGEKELDNTSDATPTDAATVSTVASAEDMQNIIASLISTIKAERQETIKAFQIETEKLSERMVKDNKKLAEKFESEISQLNENLSQKIQSETAKLYNVIEQVRNETTRELTAAKATIESFTAGINSNFEIHVNTVTEITCELSQKINDKTDDLANQITVNKEGTDKQINDLKYKVKNVENEICKRMEVWQNKAGEKLAQLDSEVKRVESPNADCFGKLNADITNLRKRISQCPTAVCDASPLQPPTDNTADRVQPPHVSQGNMAATCASDSVTGNNSNASMLCDAFCNGVNQPNMCEGTSVPAGSCMHNNFIPNDLTLPYFYDSGKVNAVFHLRQLDEYIKLKGIPKHLQLAIAMRSVTDVVGRSWLAAVSHTLVTYEDFKMAFKRNFWNEGTQSLVKCSIYQDRYQKQYSTTMSNHFREYTVLATYLEPKMADREQIDALKFHFDLPVQRSFATAQLTSIQDAVDLIKRLEMVESIQIFQRSQLNQRPQTQQHNPRPPGQNYGNNNRPRQNHQYVRQIGYSSGRQFNQNRPYRPSENYERRQGFHPQQEGNNPSPTTNHLRALSPHAPTYCNTQVTRNASHNAQGEVSEN
jgi:hypothetical protein